METHGIQIIQASNQQIATVLLANLGTAYFAFSTNALNTAPFIVAIGLSLCSAILSFGYLMLLTSTYERTGSYSKSRTLCNNLAFGAAFTGFFAILALAFGVISDLFSISKKVEEHTLLCVLTLGVIGCVFAVFFVGYKWWILISSHKPKDE